MFNSINQILTTILYWITRARWLIIAAVVGVVLYCLPPPEGLSLAGYRTIIIVVVALILIIKEPLPLPGVGLMIIVLQVYLGIGEANQVARAFMNDAVFFIMGSLMLAVAIITQGWDARLALGLSKLTGNRTHRIAFGLTVLAALLSSFIGEHTVTALLLPIAMTLIRYTNPEPKNIPRLAALLLFSIAYGSLVGSIGTPSGGGRNAIMLTYWREFGIEPLSYLEWIMYVYPLVLLQLPIVAWILWKTFPPERLTLDSGLRKLKVQVARAGPVQAREILALVLFGLVFLGWITLSEKVGLGIIALSGVLLFLIFGLASWEDMAQHVNWGVVILFGATISLGTQINHTGAARWLATGGLNLLGDSLRSVTVVTDTVVVILTTLLSNVLSSSATVAVLGPITLNFSADPIHTGLVTAIASAFGYFTAVAAPACTIIYASGLVGARDFLKAGWKMGLVSILLVIGYANIYWRLLA